MTLICPECGSSKMELVQEEFTETIKKGHANGVNKDVGINSHIKLGLNKTESENNEAVVNIQRWDRFLCGDCGNSFPKDNIPDPIINGYKISLTQQFIEDYSRETAKYNSRLSNRFGNIIYTILLILFRNFTQYT